uniref:Uncharacterized protein n=1 Tax=Anopheles farauti TaxID=69004 RepID=A0A182Q8W4_9DIPT
MGAALVLNMKRLMVAVLVILPLFCVLVPNVHSAPQRSIDFLLGDEELQAVVKPIAGDSAAHTSAQVQENDEQSEVQATVDPIENEQQTEEPQEQEQQEEEQQNLDVEGCPEEEQCTENPQDDLNDAETDGPDEDEQSTTEANMSTTFSDPSPKPTSNPNSSPSTSSSPKDVTTQASTVSPPSTTDSAEDNSSEERLTTNPIVVPETTEEQTTTESSEDSSQLAQDVNDFIHDLTNEVRSSALDKPRRPQPPTPNPPVLSTQLPPRVPERYDSKSLESHENDDQVQLKVNPNDEQTANGPSLTEDQFRTLIQKLPWYNQHRIPGYEQWPQQSFPQRSSWQHRDDRHRQYQPSHGLDSFQGHGQFHRSSWH